MKIKSEKVKDGESNHRKLQTQKEFKIDSLIDQTNEFLIATTNVFIHRNHNNQTYRILLYALYGKYQMWVIDITHSLEKVKTHNAEMLKYFTEWLAIEDFQPKDYNPEHYPNEKDAKITEKIVDDSNKFKNILGKRIDIFNKIKNTWVKKDTFEINKRGSEIWVNEKYLINKPHYNNQNELFFDFAFNNPNRKVTKAELKESLKGNLTKKISSIINELGFTSEIRKAFFPKVSGKTAFYFRNPLNENHIKKEEINVELLIQELLTQNLRKNKNKSSDFV